MNICIFCKIVVMLAKKNAFFEAFFFYVSRWHWLRGPQKLSMRFWGSAEALRTSMSLERSRKTQPVSEGAERARSPRDGKGNAVSTGAVGQKFSRNSEGVQPLDLRKRRLKWQIVLKPHAKPISETDSLVLSNIRPAIPSR